jgi:raffinose/stachyose/melibiose transport system substrate-binding protein
MLTTVLLAACGDPTTSASPTTGPAAAPSGASPSAGVVSASSKVTLSYILSKGWDTNAEQELARRFEAESGIHIDFQIVPADQYTNILKVKLVAQNAPDIFGAQSGASDLKTSYDIQKNGVDLSQEEWVRREDPLSVAQTTLDGKVYGLTLWDTLGTTWVVNYNKAIFQRLGLSVPKTYAEFKALCLKIQAAGINPLYEPVSSGWHTVLWFIEIGPRYEELSPGFSDKLNANQATFAGNPTMLLALQQLKEMYNLGFFGPTSFKDLNDDVLKNLVGGKYAMALHTIGLPTRLQKEFPDSPDARLDNWGYFVMPLADNQILNVNPGGPSKFIYSGSKHIEEAKAYFRFLTRPDNLQYLLDNEPAFSGLNFSGVKDKFTTEQKALFAAYPRKGLVYQSAVNYFDFGSANKNFMEMFLGSLSPEEVLKKIDNNRAVQAKAVNDPAWKN